MFLTIDCPDELFADVALPGVMTGRGVQLEAVEEVPAGPWLAAVVDCIDPRQLSEWDLPAYLRACARVQAWAAARVSDGVAELASRPGGFGADNEIAFALREPVGATQNRPPATREPAGCRSRSGSSSACRPHWVTARFPPRCPVSASSRARSSPAWFRRKGPGCGSSSPTRTAAGWCTARCRRTGRQLSVSVDDSGSVKWTSVLGQSRTVTPYDYGMHVECAEAEETTPDATSDSDPPF